MEHHKKLEAKAQNAFNKNFFLEAIQIYYSLLSFKLKEFATYLEKKPIPKKKKKINEILPIIRKHKSKLPDHILDNEFNEELIKLKTDRDILDHDLVNKDIDYIMPEELARKYKKAFEKLTEQVNEIQIT